MAVMFTQGLRLKLSEGFGDFQGTAAGNVALACCRSCAGPYRRTGYNPSIQAFACDSYRISDSCGVTGRAVPTPQYLQEGEGALRTWRSLHLSLALLSIITVPAVLYLLSEALGFQAEVSVFQVGKTVVQAVLLPVVVGMVFGAVFPKVAGRIGPTLSRIAEIGLLVMVVLV